MAITLLHGNKKAFLPGVYSQIKSAIKNNPTPLPYNNVIIIDTGSSLQYGAAGINGQYANKKDAIYSFDNIDDFRQVVRGGVWWKAIESLFRPNAASPGVGTLYWVSASTSTAASITYTLTNGSFVVRTAEGVGANGVLDSATSTELVTGYASLMKAGSNDPNKFVFEFYGGTYRGLHTDALPFDGQTEDQVIPELLARSPELDTLSELYTWMERDVDFGKYFKLQSNSPISGTDTIVAGDLNVTTSVYNLAVGGTRTYSNADLVDVFESICDLDYTFVLADNYQADAQSANNVAILTHLIEDARFEKFLVVGGGSDRNGFTGVGGSIETAQFYNSEKVICIHGGIKLNSRLTGNGYREYESIYKAAFVLGRIAGLEPQIPGTFKAINVNGETHSLTDQEKEVALKNGVLYTHFDTDLNAFTIGQAINSLQQPNNEFLVTEDGRSYEISIMRIAAQINKEIVVNAKIDLLGNQSSGPNRGALTTEDVRKWTENYLARKTVRSSIDNLIISFRNVVVDIDRDAYRINYQFEPNFPVNKLLFTGYMIDTSVSI